MEGIVYAAYCHTQDIACTASIAGVNNAPRNAHNCIIKCKVLERVTVGMVLSSKQ